VESAGRCSVVPWLALRHRLLDAVGTTIDDYGGSFVMSFETVLIAATQLG
jgi:hypothetical protein